MKTDRELLELAAKAAGIDYEWDGNGRNMLRAVPFREYTNYEHWNPLTDDGDALRLAVKRRIKVRYNEALGQALAWTMGAKEADAITVNIEDCNRDECSATRRAIVLASIGEATP